MYYLGVDTGLVNPAFVLLSETEDKIVWSTRCKIPTEFSLDKRLNLLQEAVRDIIGDIVFIYKGTDFSVVIERPEFQTRGMKRPEDTFKLAFSFGVIFGALSNSYFASEITSITPSQWKGQLPKAITKKRMIAVFGEDAVKRLSHDEVDALALAYKLKQDSQ